MGHAERREVRYDLTEQRNAYAGWAGIYDKVYHNLLANAQQRLATAAARCGPSILEVGVGTGLVLRYYPASCRVIGVDLSEPMLRKAADKVERQGLRQVAGLGAMDACRLGFRSDSFDAVTLPFVITLVPEPEGALDEAARVVRPGGEIIVASKLGDDHGVHVRFEEAIAPIVKKVGWSSAFKLSRITSWAERRGDMRVEEVAPAFPAGFFKIVRLRKLSTSFTA